MFLSSFRADAGGDRSPWGSFWFDPIGMRTQAGARVTPATAMTLPAVFACVKVLAESFAIMPFMLYRPKAAGGREKVVDHWLYRLIAKKPNQFQTPYEWRLMLEGHLALRGNAFCQITANGKGEITELLPLHPDRMAIEPLDNGSYRYLYTDQSGNRIPYARQDIWHLRGMSDDGYMGLSPIGLAREAIGEGLAIQSYSTRFFANDAKPGGGWIEFPGSFNTTEAKQKFREGWQTLQGGANRGKVAVLEKGMKFHELGLSNKDSQFIEARKAKEEEIASIFRVPPHKIGVLTRSTNNNIEHQSIEFWTDTMLPWSTMWQSSISFFLLGPEDELTPDFDYKPMTRGDGQARAERLARLTLSGILMRNEAREEEGYDPIDGLDEPLQPVNMVTLEQAELQQQQQQQQPAAPSDDAGAAAQVQTRMAALLRSNASRLAKRAAKEGTVAAALVAEAMAVPEDVARSWCAVNRSGAAPEDIAASLVDMAGGFQGALPAPAPVINITAPVTVNNSPPAVTVEAPITNNLPPAQVSVEAPVVNVETPQPPAVTVSVAAPTVNVTTPEPVVHVSVEAPDVHVTNTAPAAPNVSVTVEAPKQADKPWPTRTTIKQRDDQGRADVIETTPIDK